MAVNQKKVRGRRKLTLTSLDALVAEAERLVDNPGIKTLGNWPLTQLLTHLAVAMEASIDGISNRAPWYIRFVAPFIKGRVIRRGVPPGGYTLPPDVEARLFPTAETPRDALEQLRRAVQRIGVESMTAIHPVFGRVTQDDWLQLHLRHAELHLSFAVLPDPTEVRFSRATGVPLA